MSTSSLAPRSGTLSAHCEKCTEEKGGTGQFCADPDIASWHQSNLVGRRSRPLLNLLILAEPQASPLKTSKNIV
jgi:hypothetical protein